VKTLLSSVFLTILAALPAAFPQEAGYMLELNVNRAGMDLRHIALDEARPELCERECTKDLRCRAFPSLNTRIVAVWIRMPTGRDFHPASI
jgi:hypothetical protein